MCWMLATIPTSHSLTIVEKNQARCAVSWDRRARGALVCLCCVSL